MHRTISNTRARSWKEITTTEWDEKFFFIFFDKWYRSCRYSDYACQIDITFRKKRCLSRLCNWKTNIFTLLFLHGLHITVILYPAKVTASIFHLSFCLETKQQKKLSLLSFFFLDPDVSALMTVIWNSCFCFVLNHKCSEQHASRKG